MIDWNALIPVIYQGNVDKGFWEAKSGKVRSLAECKTLMHSEVSEACEWYRDGIDPEIVFMPHWQLPDKTMIASDLYPNQGEYDAKPVGIPSELADVCIRVCDAMGRWNGKYETEKCLPEWGGNFLEDLYLIHVAINDIMGYPFVGESASPLLTYTESIAAHYNIDLAAAVAAKMAYNATRGRMHGKQA